MTMKNFDGKGGSIAISEGGEMRTKSGGIFNAPKSLLIAYHGQKIYISVETMRFIQDMLEEHTDLARVVNGQ
jgi:hypothetical protein